MKNFPLKQILSIVAVIAVAIVTAALVQRYHRPGQLDVIGAQAMDMSAMRPPTGAAVVQLATVRQGSLGNAVTYTGTVLAYNEQDISPRTTGTITSMTVYPGDQVQTGEVLAQLDSAELDAKTQEAEASEREAEIGQAAALATHHLHHRAALDQASSQTAVAEANVADAQAELVAAQSSVADSQDAVQSATASNDYWTTEIAREKTLADEGAVSLEDYQNELAQTQSASAAVAQANAKVQQALSMVSAARAKLQAAQSQVAVANAGEKMANADLAVALVQADEAGAGADVAGGVAREARIVEGYTTIISPSNGVVTERPVAPGTLVQPGTVILKVAELDRVRIQANVAVDDLAGIRVGSPVNVTVGDSGEPPFQASVSSVFPSANPESRTSVVEAIVPNPNQRLLPGAFVTMQITKVVVHDKLLVPASAVLSDGGETYLWTAHGSQIASGTAQTYECVICHVHYTAAQAKKFNYHDPMEGGKLIPVPSSISPATASGPLTAHRIVVATGASDGAWTEVTGVGLASGDKVVENGTAGLTEGANVTSVAWGSDGPDTLPSADTAAPGANVYRCEKCGMTYSAADAAKNGYVDPMDGGKLDLVRG